MWGTSFSGGHAIVTAAKDRRIAAAIVQGPFTDGIASALAIDVRTWAKVVVAALRDLVADRRGGAPIRVQMVGKPAEAALITAPDALNGVQSLWKAAGFDAETTQTMIPARIALEIPRNFPGRRTRDVACPILFNVCATDSVTPAAATLKHAARAPRGEVVTHNAGHFDIYTGALFEEVATTQVAFLRNHVPAG